MSDDLLDSLVDQLNQSANVDPTALGEHPRYSQFKNASRAAEQQAKRREEALERHREGRYEKLIKLRNLAFDDTTESEYDEEEDGRSEASSRDYERNPFEMRNKKKRPPRYADQLLLSEWLVDIPTHLSDEWYMMPAPVGKRALVVAARGRTTAYNKAGRPMVEFQSQLPGGRGKGKHTYTVLDCIMHEATSTFYVLDLLCWNQHEFAENPFDLRRFMLTSRMMESPELKIAVGKSKWTFEGLPCCKCTKEDMEKMMAEEYQYRIDGLLFYHQSVIYEPGQSPLVGWLKPWMLPEILGVSVDDKYKKDGENYSTSQQFIEQYNKKHKHESKIEKGNVMDVDDNGH